MPKQGESVLGGTAHRDNQNAADRARFVSTALPAPPGFSPQSLEAHASDARGAVYLQDFRPKTSAQQCADSNAKIAYRTDEPDRVALHVTAPCHGFLVLADLDFPGWKAFVDGNPTPIYRANYAFRAVEVGPGAHDIVFSYNPWTVEFGIPLALLSGLGLVAFFMGEGFLLLRKKALRSDIGGSPG